jgi:methionyl aminopeptidase
MTKLIKNQKEIEGIKISCRHLAELFVVLENMVKPGMTTGELEQTACDFMAKVGGRPAFKNFRTHHGAKPFPTALCASINEEIVHAPALPSRTLKEGDIIGVDAGMELNGYYSDMARTIAVGKIKPEAQKLLNVTKRALDLGVSEIAAGKHLDNIGRAIQSYVEAQGFGVVRDLVGHGVGLAVHEDPQIPHYAIKESGLPNVKLQAGMVLAIEPMITAGDWHIADKGDGFTFVTADGSLTAQFEDTVLVTADGHEILTRI